MIKKALSAFNTALGRIGTRIAAKLNSRSSGYLPYTPSDFSTLCSTLQPGDILLIEGDARISNAIKYLTQSTWSHAAIYVGDVLPVPDTGQERPRLIEVNLGQGCVASPLTKYQSFNTRICRPVGLSAEETEKVVNFMVDRIGLSYDLRNIFDLLRYLFPTPPVPVRWRRRMIALGSGDPTRAICSSLIAQAFQSIRYPILPSITQRTDLSDFVQREIYHIRHHSLFTPRDFDLSPYFEVIKPTLRQGFDHRSLFWEPPVETGDPAE